ncbi:MAG: carbohydrate hydrolase [Acidimicrobiaceae bacterium]|nr:carbohydrate hydrolase [Acidimicrobiaceae bacterium]
MNPVLTGYRRPNGLVGVRNHVLVVPVRAPANAAVRQIADGEPACVAVTHEVTGHELADTGRIRRTIVGFVTNPNVASVLFVGIDASDVWAAEAAAAAGQAVEFVTLAAHRGTAGAVEAGRRVVASMIETAQSHRREPIGWEDLILGLECGGSDGLSGITANPAVGVASDLLVAAGGTAILGETPELIGAEDALALRAVSPDVARRVLEFVGAFETAIRDLGIDVRGAQPTPGNQAGGLTTIEEKALGSAKKGGRAPVVDVLEFATRPSVRGLNLMDTPGHDIEQMVGMVAGGAQVVVFTTGRGTPTGSPIAPCIKIASNSALSARMGSDIDMNAGAILEGTESIESMGARIFERLGAVASGETTASERGGNREFAISRIVYP